MDKENRHKKWAKKRFFFVLRHCENSGKYLLLTHSYTCSHSSTQSAYFGWEMSECNAVIMNRRVRKKGGQYWRCRLKHLYLARIWFPGDKKIRSTKKNQREKEEEVEEEDERNKYMCVWLVGRLAKEPTAKQLNGSH